MARKTWTKEEFWAQLEELGEDKVRENIATRIYTKASKRLPLAEVWLRQKDQARSDESAARSDASNFEQIRIARSAKNAAWAAAIAAIIAAICAIIVITSDK